MTSGISKADFLQRVMVALNDRHESPTPMSTEGTSTNVSTNESNRPAPSLTSHNPTPAEHEQSSVVRELLAERSVRMERKKREQDAAEKAERAMKAAARKEALETADPTDSNKTADMKYALLQKNRQQDARNERARILKCVEDDKAERRAKEALRKDRVKVATEFTGSQIPTPTQPVSGNLRGPFKDQECGCALQIRLFDGSTIRSRFSLHNTLQKEVRQWVDAQLADKDIPYTFKQVLTPHPNRTITISEEEDSLQSLGLNPSATLILIPVKDYTSAYESDAPSYISRGISAGAGLVSFGIKMVTGTLGGFLASSTISGLPVDNENHSSSRVSAAANTWTFREQEGGPEEHQLYNGNNVSLINPCLTSTRKAQTLITRSSISSREGTMMISKTNVQYREDIGNRFLMLRECSHAWEDRRGEFLYLSV